MRRLPAPLLALPACFGLLRGFGRARPAWSDCSDSSAPSAESSSSVGTSFTAVPYAATSLIDWVISLQSKRSPSTASAPAA